jgi:hypothetical protein
VLGGIAVMLVVAIGVVERREVLKLPKLVAHRLEVGEEAVR